MNLTELRDKLARRIAPRPISIKETGGGSSSGQITNANVKNFIVKAVGNVDDSLTQDFNSSEIDLSEIRDAINADSYIKLSVMKYAQLIFKAGYHIVSDNDAAAEYIQNRFSMMSFMTSTPMDILFQEIANDLVAYSNAFLIKSRIDASQLGGIQAQGILDTLPVGGYFRVDPTTMQIKVDKTGTIKNYQQQVGNTTKKYKPEDVVHFYLDKEGGALFGTPRISSALEDVKMLRKIEGNALKLVYRFSSPLMQMKIGLPEAGFMATDQEVTDARKEIEKLSDDGIIITNERTSFEAIGANNLSADLTPVLKYFEARVFSALCLSSAQAGRGGAKQDADSMDEQVHDSVKYFQRTIETFLENCVINELLLEGGYNPIINVKDKVLFQFEEIDLDTKVKMQTHQANLFQSNVIPFEEMRTNLGLRSDTVDESRLYDNMIKQPNIIAQIDEKNGASSSSTSSSSKTSGPQKQMNANGAVKNTMSPQNQHGTSSANIKESASITESTVMDRNKITKRNVDSYRKKFATVYKTYEAVRNELCDDDDNSRAYVELPLARDSIRKCLSGYIEEYANEGCRLALKDMGSSSESVDRKIISSVLTNRVETNLTDMFKDISHKLSRAKSRNEKEAAFDSSEYRLRFLVEKVVAKAKWYAYVKTCAALKINYVYVKFHEGTEDDKEHNKRIDTGHFSLDDIPAFHPYCKCEIDRTRQVK